MQCHIGSLQSAEEINSQLIITPCVTLKWKHFELHRKIGLWDTSLHMLQQEKLDALKLTNKLKVHLKGRKRKENWQNSWITHLLLGCCWLQLVRLLGSMSDLWDKSTCFCLWFWLGVHILLWWGFVTNRTGWHLVRWRGLRLLSWGSYSPFGLVDHESWWRRRNGPCPRLFVQGYWWSMAWFFIVNMGLFLFLVELCTFIEIAMLQCKTLIRGRCVVC